MLAVSGTTNISKDRKQRETRQQERKKNSIFAKTLASALDDEEAPSQYKTVVYGRNGKMSMINYQTRSY